MVDTSPEALRERIRAGELPTPNVKAAAALGHPGALEALVEDGPADVPRWTLLKAACEVLSPKRQAAWASDCLEQVLPLWNAERRDDDRIADALALVREGASPSALRAQRDALTEAAYEEDWGGAAGMIAEGVGFLLDVAAGSATSANDAAQATFFALHACDEAGEPKAPADEWQRLRLAAYLLGEL